MPIEIEKMVLPSECAKKIGCRVQLVSAVKRRLGIHRRKVFPSEIVGYIKDNPGFMESDVYKHAA